MNNKLFGLGVLLASAAAPVLAQDARTPTILVLDASNSMWGQIGGEAKFQIARKAVREFAAALPAGQPLGLTAYGHRRKADCADVETVMPVGPADGKRLEAALGPLAPKGKTPLSASIVHAAEALDYKKQAATVVLVTDGLETCNADPCAAIGQLVKQGKQLTVHVIGFDMRAAEREQLQCIARAGNGTFAMAGNASELALALASVQAPAKPVAGPARAAGKLSVTPARPKTGSTFDVSWDGKPVAGDRVTLSLPEVPVGGGTGHSYKQKENKAVVTAPATPGVYELRYLDVKGGKPLGTLAVTIEAATAHVEAPATVAGNKQFEVKWSGPANPGDRIVLVDPVNGNQGRDSLAYFNVAAGGAPAKLRAPAESGELEVLYRTAQGATLASQRLTVAMEPVALRVANPVAKGKPFQVHFSGSGGPGDVIGYTPVVDPHAAGRTYFNASGGSPARLVAPTVPGKYVVQYRTSAAKDPVIATAELIVQ